MPLFGGSACEAIIFSVDCTWDSFVRSILLSSKGNLYKMQFWSLVKIAHKVTTSSVDHFIHSVRKLDDSPHLEKKFCTADRMYSSIVLFFDCFTMHDSMIVE